MKDPTANIPKPLLKLLSHAKAPTPHKTYSVPGTDVCFLAIGDTHMGHQCYNPALLDQAADVAKREGAQFVTHSGDICEGWYSSRPGHMFELTHLGGDQQVDYAVEQLSRLKMPIYAITGNHEHNTFGKLAGFDIGKQLEDRVKDFHHLGVQQGTLQLPHGQHIGIHHPDGGTAYAISYKMQKLVESLDGGTKPKVLLCGHFHKAEYIFYRNVHCFQTGTFERQTPFMRNQGIAAHCGFWRIRMKIGKEGVQYIDPRFYPAY
jgi:predicted phosphodiesterase